LPQNIPGNASNFAVNVRAPTDSDPANTSQLTIAFTDIADRTASLKSRLDTLVPGTSSQLTPRNDGDVCFVDRIGVYQWSAGSTVSTFNMGPWFQQANDSPNLGRWLLLPALADQPFGFPKLDSSARITTGVPRNGTFDLQAANSSGAAGTPLLNTQSPTDVDLPGTLVQFENIPAGTFIVLNATVMAAVGTGTTGRASIVIDDGTPKTVHQINIEPLNGTSNSYALNGIYRLINAVEGNGLLNIRLRGARVTGTGAIVFIHQCVLTALLVSP
jgi:hypothetical protein